MIEIILKVTDEELDRLDSIGILSPDMAGVLWQNVSIKSADKESTNEQ